MLLVSWCISGGSAVELEPSVLIFCIRISWIKIKSFLLQGTRSWSWQRHMLYTILQGWQVATVPLLISIPAQPMKLTSPRTCFNFSSCSWHVIRFHKVDAIHSHTYGKGEWERKSTRSSSIMRRRGIWMEGHEHEHKHPLWFLAHLSLAQKLQKHGSPRVILKIFPNAQLKNDASWLKSCGYVNPCFSPFLETQMHHVSQDLNP